MVKQVSMFIYIVQLLFIYISTTKLYLIDWRDFSSLPTTDEITPSIRYDLNGEERETRACFFSLNSSLKVGDGSI